MIRINWHEQYANLPSIEVEDSLDLQTREECEYIQVDSMWYHVQKNGIVRYFAHSGADRNEGGFGGNTFTILHNGQPKELKGPWSSRASYLNTFLPEDQQVADIELYNGRSRMRVGLLLSELIKLWDVDAYLLRSKAKEPGLEAGSFTASMASDCILKPNGMRYDPAHEYEVFAEPVRG